MDQHAGGSARGTARATARAPLDSEPVYNERGVIAEQYRDLQGLPRLEAARAAYPLPSASHASTIRAVFQAVELALLNLADVIGRAAADVEQGCIGGAMVKVGWAHGFHRVLVRLSTMPQQLGLPERADAPGRLHLADSPALQQYLTLLERFDRGVCACIERGEILPEALIGGRSRDDVALSLLHMARVANHDSTIWEQNLASVPVDAVVQSYETFVVAAGMREAVYDRVLTGDTYFTQFRGLHQIPETLGEEVNDHLEGAIRQIRAGTPAAAISHLRCVNVLADGMLASLPPMADNLVTADYHEIRENLGLTSGSHSVCLRFHMFTDLYEQLWTSLAQRLADTTPGAGDGRDGGGVEIAALIRHVDETRLEDARAWQYHELFNECLAFRAFVQQWRELHLHMPRNNLGGGYTKSLTGSPDAVLAVKKMRRAARAADPMLPLARARGLVPETQDGARAPLGAYLDSAGSLDARVLQCTGEVTQRRFVSVQERLGFFANRCPFTPPPPRKV